MWPIKLDTMTHTKQSVSISIIFGSLLLIAIMTTTIQSLPSTIPVLAQNMSNLTTTTETGNVGLVTITPEQINEIKNSINTTRQALQQGNLTEALANLSIVEEQFSVLAEET
jgi:hypothetical protein